MSCLADFTSTLVVAIHRTRTVLGGALSHAPLLVVVTNTTTMPTKGVLAPLCPAFQTRELDTTVRAGEFDCCVCCFLSTMILCVFNASLEFEVLDSVVRLVLVLVVNDLFRTKESPEVLLHHEPMFVDVALFRGVRMVANQKVDVSVGGGAPLNP